MSIDSIHEIRNGKMVEKLTKKEKKTDNDKGRKGVPQNCEPN